LTSPYSKASTFGLTLGVTSAAEVKLVSEDRKIESRSAIFLIGNLSQQIVGA
jgi:hypothetical protein